MELVKYIASDRRVYSGALCTDMQREFDNKKNLEDYLKKIEPNAHCTYFPAEGKYMIFINVENSAPKILTNNFHEDKQDALLEAIHFLRRNNV